MRKFYKKVIYKNRKILFPDREVLHLEDWKKRKNEFQKIARGRIEYFNQFYNFHFENIRIKDQKSRWGSCSAKKNINLNYRIFLLPDEIRDYIILHELCHLKEMNHSKRFWDLIKKEMPDFFQIKSKLKKYIIF